jgi:hypothetical protein
LRWWESNPGPCYTSKCSTTELHCQAPLSLSNIKILFLKFCALKIILQIQNHGFLWSWGMWAMVERSPEWLLLYRQCIF